MVCTVGATEISAVGATGNQCCVYPIMIQCCVGATEISCVYRSGNQLVNFSTIRSLCVCRSGNQCCVYPSMIQCCVGARVARVAISLLFLKATASEFLSKCPQH